MKRIYCLALLLSIIACKKEADPLANNPTPQEPVSEYYGEPFQGMPASVDDLVLYEVNIRAFSSNGDLSGVTARLDSIKALGVNVIWLMPIYPVGIENGVNSPYSVRDFNAVANEYGNLEDLRNLIDAAHQKEMAVILDFVANHTAWDHPWIDAHPDWYTQDASGNIVHPPGTNWTDVADLNFENDSMQVAMIETMRYWIKEANIDGYRCDYANGVPFEFWQRAIDSLEKSHRSNLLMLAEGDRFNHLVAGFDLRFSWAFYDRIKRVFKDGEPASILPSYHEAEYNVVTGNQGILRFITNHDESAWDETPVQLFGNQEKAIAAMVANVFIGGVPLIYGSQEVGRNNNLAFFSNDPINWNANPSTLEAYRNFMQLYRQEKAARSRSLVDYSSNEVLAFTKEVGADEILILVNTRNQAVSYAVDPILAAASWTNLIDSAPYSLSGSISLAMGDYLILKKS